VKKENGGDNVIKKTYLMILSVAIVSMLLGSLLYANLVLAGKPEPQPSIKKDSVKISILGWVTRQWTSTQNYQREVGIMVSRDYPLDLLFMFTPEQSDFNVTDIYVVVYATGAIDQFSLDINGAGVNEPEIRLPVDTPTTMVFALNPTLVQINEGINFLSMSTPIGPNYLFIYEIEVFIEYEYQA